MIRLSVRLPDRISTSWSHMLLIAELAKLRVVELNIIDIYLLAEILKITVHPFVEGRHEAP